MKCHRCGRDISGDEIYSHQGQALCQDCYIVAISPERECDPWATYLSNRERQGTGLKGKGGLSETQQVIYEFVRDKGRVTREEVMSQSGLSTDDLDPHLNVLMHS